MYSNYSIIKTVRQAKNYTQEKLAREINITLKHYQNIENYRNLPNIVIGLKIAKILGVSPYQLWEI